MMTQKQLAQLSGLSISTIRRAESSDSDKPIIVRRSTIEKIAKALEVQPEEIILKKKPRRKSK
jgi:DNA-binding Xre family transcriptional regulator